VVVVVVVVLVVLLVVLLAIRVPALFQKYLGSVSLFRNLRNSKELALCFGVSSAVQRFPSTR
jgi:Sec-independent protein translocase protein TatA